MKQSDIFTITIVASVGMVAAFFAGNAIFGDPDTESVSYKAVNPISTVLMEPDPELFNREAINPTVEVEIGTCEDLDKNGILDQDERAKCLGVQGGDGVTPLGTSGDSAAETTTDIEEVVENGVAD